MNKLNKVCKVHSQSKEEDEAFDNEAVSPCVKWTCEEVADWIESLGFPYYRDCFLSNLISGRRLILIDASALPKIGITDFIHVLFITGKIRELLRVEDPHWDRSIELPPREVMASFLLQKCTTGGHVNELTYSRVFREYPTTKFQPPLGNMGLVLPRD